MIAWLEGVVAEKTTTGIVLDVRGVGYGVILPTPDHGVIATGKSAKLYIYEHIKEDAHDLYGFIKTADKDLFEQLISVKNVGPKVATAILSIGSADTIRAAIAGGDVKLLKTAKGVGKRAAEQIVVELRDKVGVAASQKAEDLIYRGGINLADEAVQGLMALGYSDHDAQAALADIDPKLPVEQKIKLALKNK